MAINANSLNGFLQVYAYKTIPAFAADLPPRDLFTENFDASIANEGTAVITRIPTTVFGNMNNLATGWEAQQATASQISATLATLGHDHEFNVTSWATIGEQQLLNTFTNILAKQVANGISVNVFNNVTNSFYTNTAYVASSSAFNFTNSLVTSTGTGSSGLQSISTLLDNLEIPQAERYAILNPTAYQGLVSSNGLYNTLNYGNYDLIRYNGFKDVDGKAINSSYPGVNLAGFNIFKYPRINTTTAIRPYGGDVYSGGNVLAGFVGNKAGLVVAARVPITFQAPWMTTYTAMEPTSGFPLQFLLALDPSLPGVRLGIYTLFGSAQANPNAIVPIISRSN